MRKAFSLIELLIVLAIVVGLAAILFPVFTRARDNARRSSCQSNLKQIGLGLLQYVRDYDETTPRHFFDADGQFGYAPKRDQGWMQVVQPYVKSTRIFQCPSEANQLQPQITPDGSAGSSDYWLNLETSGVTLMRVNTPAVTIFSGEGEKLCAGSAAFHSTLGFMPFVGDFHLWDGTIFDSSNQTRGLGAKRHGDGSNFLFFDGHAKWLTPNQVDAKSGAKSSATFRLD